MQQPVSQHPILDDKYQILRKLGEGGMGAVYEARHTGTGRRVAVKVIVGAELTKNADVVGRFRREAMASGSIDSQHIAQVLDTGVDPATGSPYMVMELLNGEDVEQAIDRLGGPIPADLALRITAQACLGLHRAHEAGVVHRDMKPANLFLTRRDGGEVIVKLLDFGIAKVKMDQFSSTENAHLTRTGTMLGSPLYMSPEQARGKKTIDHRTDLWSLGVVLYEALTARTPHEHADTLGELIIQICSHAPTPVQDNAPWIAPEVAALVHRALALDPDQRYASASEMFEACRQLLPHGYAIHEKMFVPVHPQVRATVAPRYMIESAARAPAPSSNALPPMSGSNPGVSQGVTASGLTQSSSTETPKSKAPVFAALAAVVTLGALGGVGLLLKSRLAPKPEAAAVLAPPPPAEPAPPVAPAPVSIGVQASVRTVHLAIAPANARVEIDGHEVTPSSGSVPIEGALGSSHHVRVWSGRHETTGEIAIAEDGAIPARIDLGVSSAGGPRPGASHAGLASPAAPTAKPAAPAPPTAPTVQRDFN